MFGSCADWRGAPPAPRLRWAVGRASRCARRRFGASLPAPSPLQLRRAAARLAVRSSLRCAKQRAPSKSSIRLARVRWEAAKLSEPRGITRRAGARPAPPARCKRRPSPPAAAAHTTRARTHTLRLSPAVAAAPLGCRARRRYGRPHLVGGQFDVGCDAHLVDVRPARRLVPAGQRQPPAQTSTTSKHQLTGWPRRVLRAQASPPPAPQPPPRAATGARTWPR